MNSTFNLWTVENPMTVISSSHTNDRDGLIALLEGRRYELYIYSSWDYKTMNLNTIKITISLN